MTDTEVHNDYELHRSDVTQRSSTAKPLTVRLPTIIHNYCLFRHSYRRGASVHSDIRARSIKLLRTKQSVCNDARLRESLLIRAIAQTSAAMLNYDHYDFRTSAACDNSNKSPHYRSRISL